MVTLDEIRGLGILNKLPKAIHVNTNTLLDYRLINALASDGFDDHNRKYDFDVYLEKYKINLQRDYVWEHFQQQEFIFSILLEKPIESVVVVQHTFDYTSRNNSVNYVIDGKQRLLTIKKFLKNEFSVTINGKEYYYSDFDEQLKGFFNKRVNFITATIYYSYPDIPITDDMMIYLFNFYNFSGTPQTEEHKQKLQNLMKE